MDRRPDFNTRARRQDSIAELDLDLAEIANAVYLEGAPKVNERWRRLSDKELQRTIRPELLGNSESLYRAGVYTNDQGDHVVAFRGSYTKKFGVSSYLAPNLGQAAGIDTEQYQKASELAKAAQNAYGGNVIFTGHSLGGGLAAAAAMRTGYTAVTFNPAGLSDPTFIANSMMPDIGKQRAREGMIRKYQLDGELLQVIEQKGLAPRAPGAEIVLEHRTATGARELHKMDRLISAMELDAGGRFVNQEVYGKIKAAWELPVPDRTASQRAVAEVIQNAVDEGLGKGPSGSREEIAEYLRDKAFAALARNEPIRSPGVGSRAHIRSRQETASAPNSAFASRAGTFRDERTARTSGSSSGVSTPPQRDRPPPAMSTETTITRAKSKPQERDR
jgi:Lipase (class 3)